MKPWLEELVHERDPILGKVEVGDGVGAGVPEGAVHNMCCHQI